MILGERVRLRAIEREDLPRFVAWLNDPEVNRGLSLSIPLSQVDEENWFSAMLERPMEEHPLVIEINTPEGWKAIGNIAFHAIDWKDRSTEVGIVIGEKSLWSHGYGRDAMQLMVSYGLNTLNLNRIFLRVYATNPRAIRSYEKAGFVHEGRFRQAHFQDGQYVDVLIMSVIRSEWQA